MDVLVFASRKGGSGKSTLSAHLAARISQTGQRCLLIDADPQGSLALWHGLRGTGEPALRKSRSGIGDILKVARRDEYKWALVDTPPNTSAAVVDAIRAATLVIIPARLTVFDLAAIRDTIEIAREYKKPYAVVINGAPALRDNTESQYVTEVREAIARLNVPIWSGQITNRAAYSLALEGGEGVTEYDASSPAADEINRLWTAIEKSVKAIHGAYGGAGMHRVAA